MEREYDLKLSESDINVIFQGLENLPYKVSAKAISNIIRQVEAQNAPAPDASDEAE